jgi:hypothetical protein
MKLFFIMAITLLVNISDEASPALTALEGVLEPRAIAANVGEAEVKLFQSHFLNAGSNKNGWPTTSFWPRAAKATNWKAFENGVLINVNQQGVRQRYAGGDIFPTNGHQYLTIPARAEAYGKTAGEFNNLKVAFSRGHAFALVEADASQVMIGRKKKDGTRSVKQGDTIGGGVFFWLVKSVHQQPDPTAIPDERDIEQVAMDTLNDLIERASNGGAA